MNATNLGVIGSPAFPAAAKALDRNSVALSRSIAAVYGKPAGQAFLDGKFQWRAHIGFFVDYTVAVAKDKAGQNEAVANLKRYTVEHGKLLGGAAGLPKAVRPICSFTCSSSRASSMHTPTSSTRRPLVSTRTPTHMFMTGDLLAGAIAKRKSLPR